MSALDLTLELPPIDRDGSPVYAMIHRDGRNRRLDLRDLLRLMAALPADTRQAVAKEAWPTREMVEHVRAVEARASQAESALAAAKERIVELEAEVARLNARPPLQLSRVEVVKDSHGDRCAFFAHRAGENEYIAGTAMLRHGEGDMLAHLLLDRPSIHALNGTATYTRWERRSMPKPPEER